MPKINAIDLKPGNVLEHQNKLWIVVKRELVSNWVVSAGRKLASSTALYRVPIEAIAGAALIATVVASLVIANAAMTTSIRSTYRRSVALAWVGREFADTVRAGRWRVLERALHKSAGKLARAGSPVDSRLQAQLLATFIPSNAGTRSLLPREAADSVLYVGGSRPTAPAARTRRTHAPRSRTSRCRRAYRRAGS